ncbi:MAG TPA: hypothetical protein VFP91_11740 [Vicinamibacterales bacterium]|nr:hypothetical protein [Vicinamibacterales bacterium]
MSWTRKNGAAISSVTAGYGRNDTDHGARNAFFIEGARHAGPNTFYSRFEAVQTETFVLATGLVPDQAAATVTPGDKRDTVLAFTAGAVRDVGTWRGFRGGIGADVTFYGVPDVLQPMYTAHPVSFHVFLPGAPPRGIDGTDVEHADVAADGWAWHVVPCWCANDC